MMFLNQKIFSIYFCVFFIGITFRVQADEGNLLLPLTLTDALRMAQERNVQMIVAQERVQQALARIHESSSVLWPQVSAGISQRRQTRDLRTAGITLPGDPLVGPFNTYDARISLKQNLFDLSVMERLKLARDTHDLSLAQSRKVEQDVLMLVANLFIEAQRAEQNKKVAKAFLRRDAKILSVVKTKAKEGLGSLLEIQQAKSDYRKSLSLLQKTKTRAVQTRLDLGAALGISEKQRVAFIEENILEYPLRSQESVEQTLSKQPEIAVERKQWQQAQTQLGLERSEYFPKISAIADYGESGIEPQDANETYMLGIQASLPIFEGGLRKARLQQTESLLREQQAILNDSERNVRAKALTAIETTRQAKLQLIEKKEDVLVWEHELELARRKLRNGEGSETDMLNVWAQTLWTKDQSEEAQATYQLAQVQLAHAFGEMERLIKRKE